MTMPTIAPAMVPLGDTVRARYPSHAATTLRATAHGSALITPARAAANAARSTRLPIHRIAAAAAGTERLSSSRTGIVSTKAATTAAARGAAKVNTAGGGGVT